MEISFLIGAGFSVPAGYPLANGLNKRMRKINENEIFIHTDGVAYFLDSEKNPNAFQMKNERLFIQEFLKFYNKQVLGNNEKFHYEKFFDFYIKIIRNSLKGKTRKLYEEFTNHFTKINGFCYQINNPIYNDKYFNQLLADFFRKKGPELKYGKITKPYTGIYSNFLSLLECFKKQYEKIHMHTLNYDLLLEGLSISDAMINDFSDGFTKRKSQHYKVNNSGEKIKLKVFRDKFDKKFCLYKLHGSLNQYFIDYPYNCMIRVKSGTYLGRVKYDKWEDEFYTPDLLSGVKEKIKDYKRKIYYKPIFKHFRKNLEKSDKLIVIGYSLGDEGINGYIKNYFLSKKDSKMLIIDPKKVESPLYNHSNVMHYEEGIKEIKINYILEKLDIDSI